jgi:hypothetical protein
MFKQFNKSILKPLNIMLAKVTRLDNMRGDGFINVKKSGAGTTIGMNLNEVIRRVSRVGGGGGSSFGSVVRAACTEDAQSDNIIEVTLYESDGTAGSAIEVYCNISNGTALDEAVPRLETGDDIFITQSMVDVTGTPTARSYCVSNFQASENCTCEQLDAVFNSVTIAPDEKMTWDGVGGDSYITYNSSAGEMELWTDGVKITSWKQ